MATNIIMPALGMAQETGKLIRWIKREGEAVTKGEPVMEIETDKVTVEIEANASGTLSDFRAQEGDVIPVGQTIALILAPGEAAPILPAKLPATPTTKEADKTPAAAVTASPLARKIAEEHGLDLSLVRPNGGRVEKADVLAYLEVATPVGTATAPLPALVAVRGNGAKALASPKARRLAAERGLDLATISGSGPDGAVLAADVPISKPIQRDEIEESGIQDAGIEPLNATWRIMAERMTASWTSAPHFYLVREVRATGLMELRTRILPAVEKRSGIQPTYTDLFIKLIATALRDHPRLNASWATQGIRFNPEINVGMAVGIEDGLIVPVIHHADSLTVSEIALRRREVVTRANEHRLRPNDIADGTFTLSNLGMYNVDAFTAILNPPQAAILAVGRLADRVVPENGQPVVRPMVTLTLSCDHRVADGVRAAKFLDDLANLIEEPWRLLA